MTCWPLRARWGGRMWAVFGGAERHGSSHWVWCEYDVSTDETTRLLWWLRQTCLWFSPISLRLHENQIISKMLLKLIFRWNVLNCLEEMRRDRWERTSVEVAQYEPVTIPTQGHQQKYYTDMYRATKQHIRILRNKSGVGKGKVIIVHYKMHISHYFNM